MKKYSLYIFIIINQFAIGQINHVINGGFEYIADCGSPTGSWIKEAVPWDTLKNGGGGG